MICTRKGKKLVGEGFIGLVELYQGSFAERGGKKRATVKGESYPKKII